MFAWTAFWEVCQESSKDHSFGRYAEALPPRYLGCYGKRERRSLAPFFRPTTERRLGMEGSAARRKGTWLAPLLAASMVGLALLVVLSAPGSSTRPAQAESEPSNSPSRTAAPVAAAIATDVGGAIGRGAPQTTAIKASVFGRAHAPQYVRGSDGRVHIEYDLLSTNVLPTPVTLTRVEVRAGDGRRLLVLKGDALEAATRPILGAPTTEVAGSGAVGTVVDVEVAPGEVPKHLTNRITYKFVPGTPELLKALIGSRKAEGPRLEVPRRSATVIAPPLSGKGWWNGNGCCKPSNPRALRQAGDLRHRLGPGAGRPEPRG
jgi:hypothetical protein